MALLPVMPPRLHLGCGRTILGDWVNVDSVELPGVNLVIDLDDCGRTPLPFEDDFFEELLGSHVIEHLRNTLPLMQELHRVSKPGALATFRVPYGASDDAFEDPTHVRQYFLGSFGYFSQPYYWRADYGYRGDWKTERTILRVSAERYRDKTRDSILKDVNELRNVVLEMLVELRAVKPIREPKRELQQASPIEIELV